MSTTLADPETSVPRPREAVQRVGDELVRLRSAITVRPDEAWPLVDAVLGNGESLLTLRQLADKVGADVADMTNLCQLLNDKRYIWLAPPDGSVPLAEFSAEFRFWVRHWVRQMFAHPVWNGVLDGTASRCVLIGWVKENMHYTNSVVRHMTRAAAFAGDVPEGRALLKHYSQEWDHYALFRSACESVGVDPALLEGASPLASTRAITDLMRSIAREDPLVYNACEAMIEATAERPTRVVEFFQRAAEHYDYPADFIAPLVEHLHVDEEFEHIDIFDGLVAHLSTVSFDLMSRIMRACNALAETMRAWHAHIAEVYGALTDVNAFAALL